MSNTRCNEILASHKKRYLKKIFGNAQTLLDHSKKNQTTSSLGINMEDFSTILLKAGNHIGSNVKCDILSKTTPEARIEIYQPYNNKKEKTAVLRRAIF